MIGAAGAARPPRVTSQLRRLRQPSALVVVLKTRLAVQTGGYRRAQMVSRASMSRCFVRPGRFGAMVPVAEQDSGVGDGCPENIATSRFYGGTAEDDR